MIFSRAQGWKEKRSRQRTFLSRGHLRRCPPQQRALSTSLHSLCCRCGRTGRRAASQSATCCGVVSSRRRTCKPAPYAILSARAATRPAAHRRLAPPTGKHSSGRLRGLVPRQLCCGTAVRWRARLSSVFLPSLAQVFAEGRLAGRSRCKGTQVPPGGAGTRPPYKSALAGRRKARLVRLWIYLVFFLLFRAHRRYRARGSHRVNSCAGVRHAHAPHLLVLLHSSFVASSTTGTSPNLLRSSGRRLLATRPRFVHSFPSGALGTFVSVWPLRVRHYRSSGVREAPKRPRLLWRTSAFA